MKRTADAVIIGGGVTGASIAFHLASRGVRDVVILERKFLGAGATGRSVGIIRQLYPTPETTAMVRRSLAVFQSFPESVGGDAGYVRCGALIAVAPALRSKLEQTLTRQRALGVKAEILEPAEVARVEPRIDPEGAGAVLYEPESGYGDPVAVTTAYAAAARRLGATLAQGAEVTAIVHDAAGVSAVVTATGERIASPVIVNAAGLWSPVVARMVGLDLPIVIGRHPVFVVERGAAFGADHPVYLDLAGGSYVRPETGGLTLTGSLTDDESQHPIDPELLGTPPGFEEAATVLERTGRALPQLSEAQYRRGWVGAFDITPDWMPILDASPVRGFYVAAGMSGHGFKLSPAVGDMMAALILGEPSPVSAAPFRFARFADTRIGGTFVSSYL